MFFAKPVRLKVECSEGGKRRGQKLISILGWRNSWNLNKLANALNGLTTNNERIRTDLVDLGERLTSIETSVNALTQQFKTLSQGLAEIAPATARINQFDQMMTKQRTDLSKLIETAGKEHDTP